MSNKHRSNDKRDEFDLLSALWIIASNDTNPLITYEGIKYRLNLPNNYNIKGLVHKRGELFRDHVSAHRLEDWKNTITENPSRRPSWIRSLGEESLQKAKIELLTTH